MENTNGVIKKLTSAERSYYTAAEVRERVIRLEIGGQGSINVSGSGVSKEKIVDAMMENLRDVFMNIVQQEIIEEGEGAYLWKYVSKLPRHKVFPTVDCQYSFQYQRQSVKKSLPVPQGCFAKDCGGDVLP